MTYVLSESCSSAITSSSIGCGVIVNSKSIVDQFDTADIHYRTGTRPRRPDSRYQHDDSPLENDEIQRDGASSHEPPTEHPQEKEFTYHETA
jgi:hypothetical protein